MIAKMNDPMTEEVPSDAAALPQSVATRASSGERTFAETALKLGGKSDEEVRRMGAVDKADDQVEFLFQRQHQTANSPIHRAVWDHEVPVDHFAMDPVPTSIQAERVMRDSLQVVEGHLFRGTLHDERRKIRGGR